MIHVLATIDLNLDKREPFLKLFHALVPIVHAEEGCIEYGPAIDIQSGLDVQIEQRPNTVTVIEKWDTLDALKAHLEAPHMVQFRKEAGEQGLITSISLQVLESA